jgi:hypothetical protein
MPRLAGEVFFFGTAMDVFLRSTDPAAQAKKPRIPGYHEKSGVPIHAQGRFDQHARQLF